MKLLTPIITVADYLFSWFAAIVFGLAWVIFVMVERALGWFRGYEYEDDENWE